MRRDEDVLDILGFGRGELYRVLVLRDGAWGAAGRSEGA